MPVGMQCCYQLLLARAIVVVIILMLLALLLSLLLLALLSSAWEAMVVWHLLCREGNCCCQPYMEQSAQHCGIYAIKRHGCCDGEAA